MSVKICYSILILFGFICLPAYGQLEDQKSSLTFVIDDTYSMSDDIKEVKSKASLIFDTVMKSGASQIENFILVTFNDPDIHYAKITNNEASFKYALDEINVNGGGDCPEFALKGIEEALIKSLPGSYIYVFTDASAKDYNEFPRVKSIAQKKQSQIVFVLTGVCAENYENDLGYQIYHQLAEATSGQVFHFRKNEVGEILGYVAKTVKGRRTVLNKKKFSPGYNKSLNFNVDNKTKDVIVSLSGKNPKLDVIKPDGSEANTTDILKTDKAVVVEVVNPNTGVYTAKVGSESETSALVSGRTTLNFQHGFSAFKPNTIKDTVTRPIRDKLSYLAIELSNKDNDVELETIEILDMEDNVIQVRPLQKIKKDFYVAEKGLPPSVMFQLVVKGYNIKTKEPIRRVSLTPIEPQTASTEEKPANKATTVSLVGEPLKKVPYGDPLQLQCKVSGYPKPTIVWMDEKSGATLSGQIEEVDLPYDYITLLNLEQVKTNTSYQCRAFNDHGEDKKSVAVEATTKFIVVNVSKDTSIDFEDEGSLYCLIDAIPSSHVTWYGVNGDVLKENDDLEISPDGSVLTILNMQPELEGKYICEAKNEFNRDIFFLNVKMTGTAVPKIYKSVTEIKVRRTQNVVIACNITQGIPQPKVVWSYKHLFAKEFVHIRDSSSKIEIQEADINNAGTYRCTAINIFGEDSHDIDLIIEYPPTIEDGKKIVKSERGKRVSLACIVDGIPRPKVQWLFNGVVIKKSLDQRIYRNNTLSFRALLNHSGNYSCKAVNKLGVAMESIQVMIYDPVKITPPTTSSLKMAVGSSVTLPCEASGYPTPTIKWIFVNHNNQSMVLRPSNASGVLSLPHVQAGQSGFYVCIARNPGQSANIAYSVEVLEPPLIVKPSIPQTVQAVIDDLALRLPCVASGNPKPTITWLKDGLNIPSGEWADINDDGTLIIKNVDEKSNGSYLCFASNSLGFDTKMIYVDVLPYPSPSPHTSTIYVEVGKPIAISCDIPHKRTDILKWYKRSKVVAIGELFFDNIKEEDKGLYTCRVNTFSGSTSATKDVIVGYKPFFRTDEDEIIDFVEEENAYLSCVANGQPPPKVTWWFNNKKLNVPVMLHIFKMFQRDLGQYLCVVSNNFGTITRNFSIIDRDCLFKVEANVDSPTISFIDIRSTSEITSNIRIRREESVSLNCQRGFIDYPVKDIDAICVEGSMVKINNKFINFTTIKCKTGPLIPETIRTGSNCARGNTEMVKVGYENDGAFMKVYEICYDQNKNLPLYSLHRMRRPLAGVEPKNFTEWFDNDLVRYNYNDLYNCKKQTDTYSLHLDRAFHKDGKCCFSKRKLVNARDVSPGIPQVATYSNLNSVPHWSTCGNKNWEEVEKRIRTLVMSVDRDLIIRTGASGQVQLPAKSPTVNIFIYDGDNKRQPVPKFLWKVVQDELTGSSLAIIQVNVPDLSLREAYGYMLCRDICTETKWMNSPGWRDVKKGYTYCCSIMEFETVFGFQRQFSPGMEGIMSDVSLIPEHSLT